ncbi:MAG: T9SS type A sorting domain-containing protein [Chitinophagales bacterium]|nr:T9SS type A sorting domain-containing protein [Chitinophagales bacterium]MCO5281283.1 T9SS type A sorting domain-containing protein [Chitinophagales bacterium]OJV24131.1 MAG: hypothetical protein BGO32_03750 [Bacteroidetes bacterium 37-13]HRN94114.1 T9SS type A sorting domain-containing protein [Chitinophagales bacterium]HRP39937.1 T9SS type A sorting domain-containing protein [Chitinophagales bacterium]
MKKIFTICASLFLTGSIMAQVCSPTPPLSEPKFDPKPDSVACMVKNQPYSQTFKFRIPATAGSFTINWMAIDSVTNLPAGLTYELNKGIGGQYNANETGCVKLSGTPTSTAGQYRLGIYVRIKVNNTLTLPGELYEVASSQGVADANKYVIWVRLKDAAGPNCPCVDTTRLTTNDIKVYDGTETMCPEVGSGTGISDVQSAISQLSIAPNPVSSNAVVEFISEKTATYTAKITNLIGKEVMQKSVSIKAGNNSISFNRNELSGGVYFFTLTDGKGLITKRFIIE